MTTAQTSGTSLRRFKTYPAYKDTGVDWLGEAPEHWEVLKSTWLFSIGSGTTPAADVGAYYAGEVPWVTTSELRESVISRTEKSVTAQALRDYPALRLYPRGSLAVAMYGATIGRLGMLGIDATVNQACCVFSRPKGISVAFWYYWMLMRRPYLTSLGFGGGQPNLSQDLLRSIRAPIPPIDEQRAIAAFLDRETVKIDLLVAQKERLIALLQEQRTALITRAVTRGLDPNVPMKDSGIEWLGEIPAHWEVERTRWLFRERDEKSAGGGEELLTVSHLTGVTPRSEKEVNMFEAETTEGYKVCLRGDLAINTLWAWMGAMGVSPVDGIVSPAYNVYAPGPRLDPTFVDVLVRTPNFAREVTRYSKGVWTSRLRLYPEGFFEAWFPVPPVDEQREISARLKHDTARIEGLITMVRKAVDNLNELRSALISAAVTGKIDVRGEVA